MFTVFSNLHNRLKRFCIVLTLAVQVIQAIIPPSEVFKSNRVLAWASRLRNHSPVVNFQITAHVRATQAEIV